MLKQATTDSPDGLSPPRMLGRAVLRRLYRKVYPGCLFRTFDCVKSKPTACRITSSDSMASSIAKIAPKDLSDSLKGWLSPKAKVLIIRPAGHTEGVAFSIAESADNTTSL